MPVTCYWQRKINNQIILYQVLYTKVTETKGIWNTEQGVIISIIGDHGKLHKWVSSNSNSEDLIGVKK